MVIQDLTALYNGVLENAGQIVGESGIIAIPQADDISTPVKIDGKILMFPSAEFLAKPDWESYVAFHPLSENPMRGESEVLKLLRRSLVSSANSTMLFLMESLLNICANTDSHKNLNVTAKKLLATNPEADKTSVAQMEKILNAIGSTNTRKLVNLFLSRGYSNGKEKFARHCSVQFPILEDINTEERTIFDVKLRVKDFKGFQELVKFIIGDEGQEFYNHGTNVLTAPYLTALCKSWEKLAKRFNKLLELFGKYDPMLKEMVYDLSWTKYIDDFTDLSRLIPPLDGNDGPVQLRGSDEPLGTDDLKANDAPAKKNRRVELASKMVNADVVTTNPHQVTKPQADVVAPGADIKFTDSHGGSGVIDNGGKSWAEIQNANRPVPQQQQQTDFFGRPNNNGGSRIGFFGQQQQQQQNNWAAEGLGLSNGQPVYQQQQPMGRPCDNVGNGTGWNNGYRRAI